MLNLLDNAKKIYNNRNNVVNQVHDILKIGSKEIARIDEKANWENIGIYKILPDLLLVLSKTYANIPLAIDGFSKTFIDNVENNYS